MVIVRPLNDSVPLRLRCVDATHPPVLAKRPFHGIDEEVVERLVDRPRVERVEDNTYAVPIEHHAWDEV